jgi:hypothetical protein
VQVSFLAAFDCWALCYSAVGALEYTSAMAYKRSVAIRVLLRLGKLLPPCIHFRILLRLAIRSKSEKITGGQRRKHHLCQYYDEVRVFCWIRALSRLACQAIALFLLGSVVQSCRTNASIGPHAATPKWLLRAPPRFKHDRPARVHLRPATPTWLLAQSVLSSISGAA